MNTIAIPTPSAVTEVDRLYAWIDVAGKTHQVAIGLAKTSFVPAAMRGKPEEVTACILAGRELGMEPMAALRSIDLIDGKPVVNALGMRAVAQARGHEVWVEESTMAVAVVCGIRAGSDHVQKSVWTMERAQKAGLTGKRNWANHPSAMLVARATAEVCRLIAADALLAMPYSAEEMRDERAELDTPGGAEQSDNMDDGAPPRVFQREPYGHGEANAPADLGDMVQAEVHPDEGGDR